MKIISHRGNLEGPDLLTENSPSQIEKCLELGFDCEIDLRILNGELFLGHDSAQYSISIEWLLSKSQMLWIHCKDSHSLSFLKKRDPKFNFFWHENDRHTITSRGIFWNFPGGAITDDSIAVLPENWWDLDLHGAITRSLGICTDFPIRFREELKLV
jgi:hypothetical protein